jgi:hypothetical protein
MVRLKENNFSYSQYPNFKFGLIKMKSDQRSSFIRNEALERFQMKGG